MIVKYNLIFEGIIEIPENKTPEEILGYIKEDYIIYHDFEEAKEIEYCELDENPYQHKWRD